MVSKDFINSFNKEKRRKERVRTVRNFAAGMSVAAILGVAAGILFAPKSGKETRKYITKKTVNTVGTIKDAFQKQADSIRDSANDAEQEVHNAIKDAQEKAEDIKDNIKDGFSEVKKDTHKTAENIRNELNKPVK